LEKEAALRRPITNSPYGATRRCHLCIVTIGITTTDCTTTDSASRFKTRFLRVKTGKAACLPVCVVLLLAKLRLEGLKLIEFGKSLEKRQLQQSHIHSQRWTLFYQYERLP
jgi:hypothetical protein